MDLTVLDSIPGGFLTSSARDLIAVLPEPTLFDLPGRIDRPLFVSVLLHGNEVVGLHAVQEVLRRDLDRGLPRRMILFVGNVAAAAAGVRTLDAQLDYNRAWPGGLQPDAPEARLMQQVYDYVAARNPFASIDIHANTGLNPHYACVNRLEPTFLSLAQLFSRTIVYFETPVGVQSAALAHLCPAVTVECGKTDDTSVTAHAVEFVEASLTLSHFPEHALRPTDFDLLRTFAVVKVPPQATLSFDGSPADFRFREDLDRLNFSELAAGSSFGAMAGGNGFRLHLETENDSPVTEYFDYAGDEVRLREAAIPAMLTRDVRAVRLDCLCYLERSGD